MADRQPDATTPLRDFRPPENTRIYAVGDIHGCADLLARLHRRIAADATGAPVARKVVVYLGDYVDRGPDSAEVVETLLHDIPDDLEPVFLKGNHEQFLLDFLSGGGRGDMWLVNGGRETLESYGLQGLDPYRPAGLAGAFSDLLPDSHRRFFEELKPWHREGDYVFVHAGIRPGVALEDQREQDLLWIRGAFLDDPRDHGFIVVHGHTIDREPDIQPNRIGIDTGAFATGRLTCLVLEGAERRFLQA